jgi:hypothetical protein
MYPKAYVSYFLWLIHMENIIFKLFIMESKSVLSDKIKISFDINKQIAEEVDSVRKERGITRTQWIQLAIMEKLLKDKKK